MESTDELYNDTLNDPFMTQIHPLNVTLAKKNLKRTIPTLIPYFNFTCNILLFSILSIIGIIILSVLNDAVSLMFSGKTVLSDLNLIIPEIKRTLTMLTRLCNHPNFKSYCGLSNYTYIGCT